MAYTYDRRTAEQKEKDGRVDWFFKEAYGGGSLHDAKLDWAFQLASSLAMRLENYGGWRAHQIKSKVEKTGRSVEMRAESSVHGFTLTAFISVEGQPVIHAMFTKQRPAAPPTSVMNLLEVMQDIENTSSKILVQEHEPMDKAIMAASLFYSKFVGQIPL